MRCSCLSFGRALSVTGAAALLVGLSLTSATHFAAAEILPAAAATDDAPLKKLSGDLPRVLEFAAPDERIPVVIVMREQASRQAINMASRHPVKQERREAVKALLKATANATQGPVLDLLEQARANGRTNDYIASLWLHNMVGVTATKEVILQAASLDGVAEIFHDPPIGDLIFPVEPAAGDEGDGGDSAIECGVALMRAPEVWSDLNITGRGVVVGVIDTGCCITHPDLANQIWTNPGEIPNNNIDDDNNGFVDDVHGWSFDNNGSSSNISDTNSHGTHVSGTVAGDGTNGTTTGMAPDALIMTIKFFNSFSGQQSVWNCMQYGVDNGADILTASLGWPHSQNPNRAVWRSLCENAMAAGVIVVYAAGNEGACCRPFDAVRTPGDVPDMITVGATDCNDAVASFSSRGPVTWQNIDPYFDFPHPPGKLKPTIAAPGVNTISTSNNCSGYSTKSGTSMATPHVAGAIALMLEANPNLDHWQVKQLLQDTAIDLGTTGRDNDSGAGRVDAYEAVLAAAALFRTPAELTGFQVARGDLIAGGLNDLLESDDQHLHVKSGYGQSFADLHSMIIDVRARTDVATPTGLDVLIETRVSHAAGGLCRLALRNWGTTQFDPIDEFAVGNADFTHEKTGVDAASYVREHANTEIELRVTHRVVVPVFAFTFETFIDRVTIFVR